MVRPWWQRLACRVPRWAVHAATRWLPPRRLCPGPRGRSWSRLSPWALFRNSNCGYDLRGLAAAPDGSVTCPECGRRVRGTREMARSARRWRRGRIALTAALVIVAASRHPLVREGRWVRYAGTTPLVMIERVMGVHSPRGVRDEVGGRVARSMLSAEQTRLLLPRLIADLAADDHRWNADRAMRLLRDADPAAVPALEAALESADWQQRQFAAHVLRRVPGYEPSDAMLRVCAEGLRDDALLQGPRTYTWVNNAQEGAVYLQRVGPRAARFVTPGLSSADVQERLLCAAVAGFAGCHDLADRAVPILLDHLRDNTMTGDAQIAAPALFRFGPDIIPWLEPFEHSEDRQQRALVRLILHHLRTPRPSRPPDLEGVRITAGGGDPADLLTVRWIPVRGLGR